MEKEPPFTTWKYENQTKVKHIVFEDYFDKWVKIVGRYHKVNYFDCFGGCGAYKDNRDIKYGSPILAAQIAKKNNLNLKRNVKLVIIDENDENIENIKKIFDYLKLDIKPIFINNDFDKTVNEILDSVGNLAPTFFFIDPFGFKIKIQTLKRIMEIPRTEILLNFMYNSITRFLKLEQLENIFDDLFGCKDWKNFCSKTGSCREDALVDLYRAKLKEFSKFVCYYRISFPDKERTYYYLFHLTNHIKGCTIMKSCFAKYNLGKIEYLGKLNNQTTLSDFGNTKQEDLKKIILSIINKPKSYLDILGELIDETIYLESDIYNTIKNLEETKKIIIQRDPETTKTGKLRRSIEFQDRIIKKED